MPNDRRTIAFQLDADDAAALEGLAVRRQVPVAALLRYGAACTLTASDSGETFAGYAKRRRHVVPVAPAVEPPPATDPEPAL